jgi:succinate dehydrogenase / fumarate reductase, flavoprotein subunit
VIEKKLPDIADFCRTYLGVDPVTEPMPIQPTAHYAMGGIPTDVDCRVIDDQNGAAGALRRGRDRLRLGARRQPPGHQLAAGPGGLRPPRRAGHGRVLPGGEMPPLPENPDRARSPPSFSRSCSAPGQRARRRLREEMQDAMMDGVGIFRTAGDGGRRSTKVRELKKRYQTVMVMDKGKRFNTDLLEAWELGNLLDLAEVTAVSRSIAPRAAARTCARTTRARRRAVAEAHARLPERDGSIDLRTSR